MVVKSNLVVKFLTSMLFPLFIVIWPSLFPSSNSLFSTLIC